MLKRVRSFLYIFLCIFIIFCTSAFADDYKSMISEAADYLRSNNCSVSENPYCFLAYYLDESNGIYSICFSDEPFYVTKPNYGGKSYITSDSSAACRFNCYKDGSNSYSGSVNISTSVIDIVYLNHDVMNYDGTEVVYSEIIQEETPAPTNTPYSTKTPAPINTPSPVNTSFPVSKPSPTPAQDDNSGFFSNIISKISDLFDIVKQTFNDMKTGEFWDEFFIGVKLAFKAMEDSLINLKDSVLDFFKFFWDKLKDIFSWFDKTFKISERLGDLKTVFSLGLYELLNRLSDFKDNALNFFQDLPGKLKEWFFNLIDNIVSLKDKAGLFFSSFWDNFKDSVVNIIDKIKGFFVGIKNAVVSGFNHVTGFFKNIWTSFANLFVLPDNYFEDKFNEIFSNISEKLGL